ncbi:DUF6776 family protein [Ectopseudomonas mendocina]|uniref:DUF6776 family protein n=1 Tax=Ectopseudomonas mendocina TaxID=300 RepID=A0ABZ2RHI6_ECTME
MSGWEVLPANPRRSKRAILFSGVLFISIPLAFWAGSEWQQGRSGASGDAQQIDQLEQELEELRQQMVVLKSAEQLSLQANEQSRLTIKLLEEQIYKQQQDLAFYKGVVAPESRQEVLNIKAFELLPTESEGRYRYKVLLNRLGKGDKPLQGRLHISVSGKHDGKAQTLSLAELVDGIAGSQGEPVEFSFRHFLAVPEAAQFAEMQLPVGFDAEKVIIKAEIKGQSSVVQTFDWKK